MLKSKDEYSTKPPLNEQIDELRRKLSLLGEISANVNFTL
jgi:hypothetical protein